MSKQLSSSTHVLSLTTVYISVSSVMLTARLCTPSCLYGRSGKHVRDIAHDFCTGVRSTPLEFTSQTNPLYHPGMTDEKTEQ
jgi:hypothetical protein